MYRNNIFSQANTLCNENTFWLVQKTLPWRQIAEKQPKIILKLRYVGKLPLFLRRTLEFSVHTWRKVNNGAIENGNENSALLTLLLGLSHLARYIYSLKLPFFSFSLSNDSRSRFERHKSIHLGKCWIFFGFIETKNKNQNVYSRRWKIRAREMAKNQAFTNFTGHWRLNTSWIHIEQIHKTQTDAWKPELCNSNSDSKKRDFFSACCTHLHWEANGRKKCTKKMLACKRLVKAHFPHFHWQIFTHRVRFTLSSIQYLHTKWKNASKLRFPCNFCNFTVNCAFCLILSCWRCHKWKRKTIYFENVCDETTEATLYWYAEPMASKYFSRKSFKWKTSKFHRNKVLWPISLLIFDHTNWEQPLTKWNITQSKSFEREKWELIETCNQTLNQLKF